MPVRLYQSRAYTSSLEYFARSFAIFYIFQEMAYPQSIYNDSRRYSVGISSFILLNLLSSCTGISGN